MPEWGPYFRVETPTQTPQDARLQEISRRICGRTPRWGDVPTVEAYVGYLPESWRGVEFMTEVAPAQGTVPTQAYWRQGRAGVIDSGDNLVCIPVRMTKNNQKD
jgi:hypothetical protein